MICTWYLAKNHSWYFKIVSNFTRLMAREITCNNFETSLIVFMPNITTNQTTMLLPVLINVFIMGYVTFSLGCYMVCCSIASLAVGYIYLSCSHLYSLPCYDRPFALKIKYPCSDHAFLSEVAFFACCHMKGLARFVWLLNHSIRA